VRVRIIDKLSQPTDASRAIAVHARSLDMFDRMGIADELIATGIKAIAMQMYAGRKTGEHAANPHQGIANTDEVLILITTSRWKRGLATKSAIRQTRDRRAIAQING
jgi:2-polyprenyl-6-methoxyphenol hydroxylase-like FAD-dependent oxidoreductase